jgi:hypothetical protein
LFFVGVLRVNDENTRIQIRIRIRGMDPDPDPDPHQNVMDQEHWFIITFSMSCCSCKRPNWVRLEAAVGGIKGVRTEGGIRGAGDRWEGEGGTRGAGDKNSGEPEEEAVDNRRPNSGTALLRWKLQRKFYRFLGGKGGGVCLFTGTFFTFLQTRPIIQYDTKMLLKVISDKTAFVKFKISNNFEQNKDEIHSKQPKIHRKNPY